MRYPLVSVSAIIGAVLLICHVLGILTGSGHVAEYVAPDTGTSAAAFPRWSDGTYACGEEDGSTPGQPFPCRWEAAEQGNGHGQTFTLQGPAN